MLSKKEKLIERLKSKPKDFIFDEAESLLLQVGFVKSNKGKTSGSRIRFIKGHTKINLHKPHPRNELQSYQLSDIIEKLEQEDLI